MSRWIDADALAYIVASNGDADFINKVTRLMIDAPSIDIVRCSECVYCNVQNTKYLYAICERHGIEFKPFEDDTRTHGCAWGISRSEKPNNCKDCKWWFGYCHLEECEYEPKDETTISKMEQVETMSCAECKHRPIGAEICEEPCHYEPQTDWHYDEQDATWYPYKHEDEPQQKSCATCKHALGNWDGESNNCGRCCGADRRFYEPKDEPQTERSSDA